MMVVDDKAGVLPMEVVAIVILMRTGPESADLG
jgi:hypothetical protein